MNPKIVASPEASGVPRIEDLIPAGASLRESGPLSFKRLFTASTITVNRLLSCLPPLRWYYRRTLQNSLAVSELEYVSPRIGPDLDGLRVAFVSDLHAGSYFATAEADLVFEPVRAARPDVIFLGGDLVNSRLSELKHLDRALETLEAPLGVFAVRGNHDLFRGLDAHAWRNFLEAHGVEVLVNQGCRIRRGSETLWIAGIDDLEEGTPDLAGALDGRMASEPTLLLSHHPDVFAVAREHDVDLTLSGHTHGGQIKIRGRAWITHSHQGFCEGWFEGPGESRLYVSRGVGATALPVRRDCAPEVVLLRLSAG